MAEDKRFDPARLELIERRLQALEDAEAIRNLKARYAALCDNQYDADGIASLFTEDAVWESPALGRFEGREAIRTFFQGASGIFSFAIHYSLNGHIEMEGDTAAVATCFMGESASSSQSWLASGPSYPDFQDRLARPQISLPNSF
jgi:ketosteroid isomerase-like protein